MLISSCIFPGFFECLPDGGERRGLGLGTFKTKLYETLSPWPKTPFCFGTQRRSWSYSFTYPLTSQPGLQFPKVCKMRGEDAATADRCPASSGQLRFWDPALYQPHLIHIGHLLPFIPVPLLMVCRAKAGLRSVPAPRAWGAAGPQRRT